MIKIQCLLLILITFFWGCNIKDPSRFHGQFYFYENDKPVTRSFNSEKFTKLKMVFRSIGEEYGFTTDFDMPDVEKYLTMNKVKFVREKFLSIKGSDAFISVSLGNSDNYVNIAIHDYSYNYETPFFNKFKQEIINTLKEQFGFSDIKFEEVGVFILNN